MGEFPLPTSCQLRVALLLFSLGGMAIRGLDKTGGGSPWAMIHGEAWVGSTLLGLSTECGHRESLVWSLFLDKWLLQWNQGLWDLQLLGLQTMSLMLTPLLLSSGLKPSRLLLQDQPPASQGALWESPLVGKSLLTYFPFFSEALFPFMLSSSPGRLHNRPW